jgi:hypothetical protein
MDLLPVSREPGAEPSASLRATLVFHCCSLCHQLQKKLMLQHNQRTNRPSSRAALGCQEQFPPVTCQEQTRLLKAQLTFSPYAILK